MNLKNYGILMAIGLLTLIAFGCGTQETPTSSSSTDSPAYGPAKAIPADAVIDSARIHIYVPETDTQSVTVHAVTSDWDETGVTWDNFSAAYSTDVLGTFNFEEPGWYTLDVTPQVEGWFDGSIDNFGFLLKYGAEDTALTTIASGDADENNPYLEICYTVHEGPACEDMETVGDATIYSAEAETNYGGETELLVGGLPNVDSTYDALIKFDFSVEIRYVSIGDFVWDDADMNGLQDEGENGIEDVKVYLFDCDDNLLDSTETDGDGMYIFDQVDQGDYYLSFVNPDGYVFTYEDVGNDDALDSDVDRYDKKTVCFSVLWGDVATDWDAGLFAYNGCTYGKGYWKNHAGFGPQDDELTRLLPIWLGDENGEKSIPVTDAQTAYDILTQHVYGQPSNGVTKLYAHLLTAKLNIVNFANPRDIEGVISDVDAFLADYDWNDWGTLDKDQRKMVNQWKGQVENYNEGEIGPGSCGENRDDDSVDNDDKEFKM